MKIAIDIGSAGAGNRRDWPECVRFALEGEGRRLGKVLWLAERAEQKSRLPLGLNSAARPLNRM
jgi:hypothetical protein